MITYKQVLRKRAFGQQELRELALPVNTAQIKSRLYSNPELARKIKDQYKKQLQALSARAKQLGNRYSNFTRVLLNPSRWID